MSPHGSDENGLNSDDSIVPYNRSETALSEAVAGYAHFYSYGVSKCSFLSGLLSRPVLSLEDFGCPNRRKVWPGYSCILPCHMFNISCHAKRAFLLQVVDVSLSDKILCKLSERHETSYSHVYVSP